MQSCPGIWSALVRANLSRDDAACRRREWQLDIDAHARFINHGVAAAIKRKN
jgi:hypothetical protein